MRSILKNLFASVVSMVAVLCAPYAAHALTISPPYVEMTADPGDVVIDSLRLYNEQDRDITFYPILMDFTSMGDEGGQPKFVDPSTDIGGAGVSKWITVDPSPFVLKAKQRGNLPFTVNVPKTGAQPGSHFGAILLSDKPKAEGGTVGVSQQLAGLLFLRVTGDIREQGSIAQFGFKEKKVWYNYRPIDMFYRFENSGNVHLRPSGNVIIKNWYGRTVDTIAVNKDFSSVLPLSIRKFEANWGKAVPEGASELSKELRGFALGRYTAELILGYGTDHKFVTQKISFSVWPWRLLLIFGLGGAIALLVVWKGMKANERRIIKKYERTRK